MSITSEIALSALNFHSIRRNNSVQKESRLLNLSEIRNYFVNDLICVQKVI